MLYYLIFGGQTMSQKKLYFWEFNCTYVKKIMVAPYFAVCVSTGNKVMGQG